MPFCSSADFVSNKLVQHCQQYLTANNAQPLSNEQMLYPVNDNQMVAVNCQDPSYTACYISINPQADY
jgi:hypothetical protein